MSVKSKVSAAIYKYNMIEKGESIAVAFSGGKDSVFLADILKERRDIKEIFPIHIDNGFGEKRDEIENFLKSNFKRYHIETIEIEKEFKKKGETICYFCTWKRSKRTI
jgi:tRNA(Ile)-lysidine synthase TilS/MesJ